MSAQSAKLSQKDYLKKYLSGGTDAKKKKKKKRSSGVAGVKPTVKVIDDDVDLSKLQPLDESALNLYELTEDAPQVVGIVDERPAELQALDQYKQGQRWKVIGDSDGDVKVSMSRGPKSPGTYSVSSGDEEEFSVRPVAQPSKNQRSKSRRDDRPSPPSRRGDVSPRQKSGHGQNDSDESPPRKRRQNESDESPPRRSSQKQSESLFVKKNHHHDSDSSPPRPKRTEKMSLRRKYPDDTDTSPPRRRNDIESDVSPSRRKRHRDSDESPQRRAHHDSDMSPSRKGRHYDSDESPPRKRQQGSSPLKRKKHIESDASVLTKTGPRDKSHESLKRRPTKSSCQDQNDSDTSPPRRRQIQREPEEYNTIKVKIKVEKDEDRDNNREGKMKKTLDGKVAGLQDAKKLKQELMEYKLREEQVFAKMDGSLSGKDAVAIQRDRRTGLKRDLEQEQAEQRAKDEKENKKVEKYSRWGKGLKQTEDQQQRLQTDLYEMSKPLARYADDKDLDSYLKDQDREGDPMLEYLRTKKREVAKSRVPVYQGSFPPNRFNIRPGYRWDGVDRSSGYERKRFEAINAKKAVEEEAYKWSTSDM